MSNSEASAKTFYDREFEQDRYATHEKHDSHPDYPMVRDFVERFDLKEGRCLEIGCGRGAFQNIVSDYTGVDLASSVARFLRKPFYQCDARSLPFSDNTFHALWTIDTLEHVPEPEKALCEMRRVLKPDGLLLLAPAWHTRSWFANGYPVRPYRTLGIRGKVIKASVPLRDFPPARHMKVIARRILHYSAFKFSRGLIRLRYRRLEANYEHFWMPDSDAVNSFDPVDMMFWFVSRGDKYLGSSSPLAWICFRGRSLLFRISK